jgi:hypothetical protein
MLAAQQILSIRGESQIWDEGFEIVAGYQYLTTGEYRASVENPPLERILEAIPLLFLRPDLKGKALGANNTATADVDAGMAFLYDNRMPADKILFAARLPMIAVSIGLLIALGLWCRRRFGAPAGFATAALFALDPTVIAHGRYVKNDVTVTAFGFLAVIAWDWYLERRTKLTLISAGAALGLALGSKFSAVYLLPVFVILALLRGRGELLAWPFWKALTIAGLTAVAVLLALYAPYTTALLPHSRGAAGVPLRDAINQSTRFGHALAWAGSRLGWRAHPLLVGLAQFAAHGGGTHPAYLMGRHGSTGWWYYFPIAFAIKTPVAVLVAITVAILGMALGGLPGVAILITPILVYAAFSAAGHVDIGLRHLLPIYPFLYALIGVGLANLGLANFGWAKGRWRFRTPAVALILLATAAESWAAFPYYTSFFNVLVGGAKNGPKYLVDSNIDWGQDLKRLGEFYKAHGSPPICVSYFGTAPAWYYVPRAGNFPSPEEMAQGAPLGCEYAAVSVTPLEGVYVPELSFAWLRDVPPLARIGYSIYVWDVHDPVFQRAYASLSAAR